MLHRLQGFGGIIELPLRPHWLNELHFGKDSGNVDKYILVREMVDAWLGMLTRDNI